MTGRASSILAGVVLAGTFAALWAPNALFGDEAPTGMCSPGYARSRRLPADRYYPIAEEAYRRAGIPWSERGGYRLDHVLPLCLGGSWEQSNLQIQTIAAAALKDRLEWRACEDICAGRVSYGEARAWFTREGWRAAYQQVFGSR